MTAPALELNYQRTTENRGGLRTLLLAAGVLLLAGVGGYERYLAGATERREAELGRLKEQTQPRVLTGVSGNPRKVEEELQYARSVVQQLTLPWDRMYAAIESSDDKGIALLSIQPDAEKKRVTIGGEAKNLLVMLDYMRRLERSGALTRVNVASHEVQQQDPQHPVRFQIEAAWVVTP